MGLSPSLTPNGCSYGPARCGTGESGHPSTANLHQVHVLRIGWRQLKPIKFGVEFLSCYFNGVPSLSVGMDERMLCFVVSRQDLFPDRCWGIGAQFVFGEVFCAPQFTMFDHSVWCAAVAFHFPPVRPEVLLPQCCEVLGGEFIEFWLPACNDLSYLLLFTVSPMDAVTITICTEPPLANGTSVVKPG